MRLTVISELNEVDVERIEGCVCLNGYKLKPYDHGHRFVLLTPDDEVDHTLRVCFDFVRELNREGFTGKIELVL